MGIRIMKGGLRVERMATAARSSSSVATKTRVCLTPTALQGLEVLALPVASLPEYIEQAAESNPLIEIDFSDGLFSYGELPENDGCGLARSSQDASAFGNAAEITPPSLSLVIANEARHRL